jgi:hypothetical protein
MTDPEVWAVAERILALNGELGISKGYRQISELQRQLHDLTEQLAAEYGRRRGWLPAKSRFTLEALRDRKQHSYRCYPNQDEPFPSFFDHCYFYRMPDRTAAAIVAHPYSADFPRISAWAAEHGLRAEMPADFPSWHFPGRTVLLVFTPLKEHAPRPIPPRAAKPSREELAAMQAAGFSEAGAASREYCQWWKTCESKRIPFVIVMRKRWWANVRWDFDTTCWFGEAYPLDEEIAWNKIQEVFKRYAVVRRSLIEGGGAYGTLRDLRPEDARRAAREIAQILAVADPPKGPSG